MAADKDQSSKAVYDMNTSVTIADVSAESVAIPAGAAGDVVECQLQNFPVRDESGGSIAGLGDTSLVLTATAFTTEVYFGKKDEDLADGEYYLNPITGEMRGKKADATTSMTVDYKVATPAGSGGGISASVSVTNTPDVTPQVAGADVSSSNPMPVTIPSGTAVDSNLQVAGADVDATNPVQIEIIEGGSVVDGTNKLPVDVGTPDVNPQLGAADIDVTNPMPSEPVVGGAVVDSTNPVPVENIIGGAAVSSTNRYPVEDEAYTIGQGYSDFWDEATDTFESTDSPATYDLATDLGMNAKKLAFVNRGAGAIQVELDWNNAGYTTTFYVEPNGGTWAQDKLDISDVRVTHNGTDTSYQFTAFA